VGKPTNLMRNKGGQTVTESVGKLLQTGQRFLKLNPRATKKMKRQAKVPNEKECPYKSAGGETPPPPPPPPPPHHPHKQKKKTTTPPKKKRTMVEAKPRSALLPKRTSD